MIKHTKEKVLLVIAAFAMIAWCGPRPAGAAKSVFQRTKPHCNVQTVDVFDGGDGFLAVVQAELLVFDETGEAYGEFHLYGENGQSLQLKAVAGAVQDDPLVVFLTLEEIGHEQDNAPGRYLVICRVLTHSVPGDERRLLWDIQGEDIHYQFEAVGDILRFPPPAPSTQTPETIKAGPIRWDRGQQAFVVPASLMFGIATAGKAAGFALRTTLEIADPGFAQVTGLGPQADPVEWREGGEPGGDHFVSLVPQVIHWDRNGGTFAGDAIVTTTIQLVNLVTPGAGGGPVETVIAPLGLTSVQPVPLGE